MKSFFFVLAFASALSPVFSQKISGTIGGSDGKVAEFASVLLRSGRDSSLVKGAATDETGHFEFENVAAGRYFIQASLVGAGKAETSAFDYAGGDKFLEKLDLQAVAKELAQVTVSARKPIVEVRADKTVLNIEGNISASGQNALELLRKAPGATVDNNDNITLKGKSGVKFQIDGRAVPLDAKELANLLKSMRAEDITAIEVIGNPSAKFDASGTAGIINFRTKKQQGLGTNGNIGGQAMYGKSLKGGGNISLNNRGRHLNLFGTYSNYFGDHHNYLNLFREQDGSRFDQRSKMLNNEKTHNLKLGADWFLNDKNTLGFLATGGYSVGPRNNTSRTEISSLANPQLLDSVLLGTNTNPEIHDNTSLNFNYRFADTLGHSLNVDLDRGWFRSRADSYQTNFYVDPTEQTVLSQKIYRNNTPTDVDIMTAKADWEQNLGKGKLATGAKVAHVKTNNVFDFYNVVDEISIKNIDRSNQYQYDETVLAGYLNYAIQWKKWGMQAGLRAENTDWCGTLSSEKPGQEQQVNKAMYLDWFPSGGVTFAPSPKHQFALTYSRRIDRPNYRDLNPFESKLDELTYQKGNPYLRPQYTNSLELTHTFMGFINTTLGYSRTNDVFTQYIDTPPASDSLPKGTTFITNGNVATQDNYSLSLSVPLPPLAKWYEGYLSVTGVHSDFEANFRPGYAFTVGVTSLNLYMENTVKLPGDWSVQVSGWYNSPTIWGAVFRSRAMGSLDLSVQKKILDGKGELRLAASDLLGTAGWRSVNDFTPGLYMRGSGNWESQNVRLSFNYRFGNKGIKAARRRETGMEQENRRIKSGN